MALKSFFLTDDRGRCADKRMGGSRAKLHRCDGGIFYVESKAKLTQGCQALVRDCCHLQKNGRLHRSRTNVRFALVIPRMQVQEPCGPRLPSSFIRIEI